MIDWEVADYQEIIRNAHWQIKFCCEDLAEELGKLAFNIANNRNYEINLWQIERMCTGIEDLASAFS